MGFVIEEFHAFVAVGKDGDEGLVGMKMGDSYVPFIAADKERFERLMPMAIEICKREKQELKILRFSTRTDVTDQYIT